MSMRTRCVTVIAGIGVLLLAAGHPVEGPESDTPYGPRPEPPGGDALTGSGTRSRPGEDGTP